MATQAAIDRLKRRRAVVRTSITKLLNDIDVLLATEDTYHGELQEKFEFLLSKESTLKELDREMEAVVDCESIEEEMTGAEVYYERISVTKTRLRNKLTEREQATARLSLMQNTAIKPVANQGQTTMTVKLPKLEITKFQGDIQAWQGFWSQFDCTIHQSETLSEIDKFKYLKSYLTGKAAAAIEGLAVTTENYRVAIDLLKERFGQKELIIESHMSRLLAIKPVHDSRNVNALRSLYDETETEFEVLTPWE